MYYISEKFKTCVNNAETCTRGIRLYFYTSTMHLSMLWMNNIIQSKCTD